jgi:hypothetical protein
MAACGRWRPRVPPLRTNATTTSSFSLLPRGRRPLRPEGARGVVRAGGEAIRQPHNQATGSPQPSIPPPPLDRIRTYVLFCGQAAHRRMVRAWAAPHVIRHVPVHSPLARSADGFPAVLAPAPAPVDQGPGVEPVTSYYLLVTRPTCFEVDPTGATPAHFIRIFESRPVFQLPSAPQSHPRTERNNHAFPHNSARNTRQSSWNALP